jgi:hypothetical protein
MLLVLELPKQYFGAFANSFLPCLVLCTSAFLTDFERARQL